MPETKRVTKKQVGETVKASSFFASSASEPLSGTGHCKTKEGKQETGS